MLDVCRLQFLAQYQWGLRASLDLLGLIPSDLHVALHQLKQLALTRAGLTQAEVRCPAGLIMFPMPLHKEQQA
jgi:hypothetical protein